MYFYKVKYGDTIQQIGTYYNINWTDIATINGLEWPYIDTTPNNNQYEGNDTVAKIGTKLMIPISSASTPEIDSSDTSTLNAYAYGSDLDIWSEQESAWGITNLDNVGTLTDNGNGDLKLARGMMNLKQQLTTRLATPRGSLLLHPRWGCDVTKYCGRKVTQEVLIQAELEVASALLEDFRVEKLGRVTVDFSNKTSHINVYIKPIEPYEAFTLDAVLKE